MALFERMQAEDHEQVVFCTDRNAGLTALIAIHDTTLGPSLGGIRMRAYASEDDAVTDVLRLSQAMTYKASLAGLEYGGGKAVVIAPETPPNREVLFRALGRAIESLAAAIFQPKTWVRRPQILNTSGQRVGSGSDGRKCLAAVETPPP